MNLSDLAIPPTALALRVGCALEYFVDALASILLKIEPYPTQSHVIIDHKLTIDNDVHVERRVDCHGNAVLSTILMPGLNAIRYDAILHFHDEADVYDILPPIDLAKTLPADVWMYTFPSRYCESDKLIGFAAERFGAAAGLERAQAICDWTHQNIEYRYGSGDSSLSACEAIERKYGVCRDFAHVMVALCRAIDMPARYVAGHIPLLAGCVSESDIGIDFHAYVEVYVNGAWHVFDPRHGKLHNARVKIAHGMDAVDAAIATFAGAVTPLKFEVWSYEIAVSAVRLDDPVLSFSALNGEQELATISRHLVEAIAIA